MAVERYFFRDEQLPVDPISGEKPLRLKYHPGKWLPSTTKEFTYATAAAEGKRIQVVRHGRLKQE